MGGFLFSCKNDISNVEFYYNQCGLLRKTKDLVPKKDGYETNCMNFMISSAA